MKDVYYNFQVCAGKLNDMLTSTVRKIIIRSVVIILCLVGIAIIKGGLWVHVTGSVACVMAGWITASSYFHCKVSELVVSEAEKHNEYLASESERIDEYGDV